MLEDRNQIGITWDEYYPETGRITGSKEEGSNPGQRESPGFGRSRTPWHIYFFVSGYGFSPETIFQGTISDVEIQDYGEKNSVGSSFPS
jgi:hypothetical protein